MDYVKAAFAKVVKRLPEDASYWQDVEQDDSCRDKETPAQHLDEKNESDEQKPTL